MAFDPISRALAVQALQRQPHGIEAHGGIGTPSAPALQNTRAFQDALQAGRARLVLAGDDYPVAAIPQADPVRMQRVGQQPAILIPTGLRLLDGRQATLHLGPSLGILAAPYASHAFPAVRSELGADVAAGATTLTLAAGEGARWAAGDEFVYRFGSLPYDAPEPLLWGMGRVLSVTGDVLTIDAPIPAAFAITGSPLLAYTDEFGVARTNKAIHKWPLITDLVVRDLNLVGSAGPGLTEIGFYVQGGRRLTLSNITARNVGTGIALQYVDGALLDSCSVIDSSAGGNLSLNKAVGLAETRGVEIRNLFCSGVKQAVTAEAHAEAWISGGRFHNTGDPRTSTGPGAQCVAFAALGRSSLTVRDFTITGHGGYVLAEVANGAPPEFDGAVRFEGRLTLVHPTMPESLGPLANLDCLLDLTVAGRRELWDFPKARWFTRRVWLRNGQYQINALPPGILRQVKVHTSAGVTPGADLTHLFIGRTGDNGNNYVARLVAGRTVTIPLPSDGSAVFARRSEQVQLLAITSSGTGLDAASEFIDIQCEIVPDQLAPDFGWTSDEDARNLGPSGGLREARFAGFDLSAIAAGGTRQVDFTIPDMAPGDLVEALSFGIDRAGITVRDLAAVVGSCRATFENLTGSPVDLGPATVRILWRKPPADS